MEELASGRPDDWAAARSGPPPGPLRPVAALDLTGDSDTDRHTVRGPGGRGSPGTSGLGLSGLLLAPAGPSRPDAPPPPPRIPFQRYVVEHADRFLASAYLLTGDRERAEELLRTSLIDAAVGWVRSTREPDADVLHAMSQRWAGPWWSWWRDTAGRRESGSALEGDVGAGLGRLSRRYRVAVVLRYHQRLTEEETAAAIGAPVGNVRTWLSRALDELNIDTRLDLRPGAGPGMSRGGLSVALARLAAQTEAVPGQAVPAQAEIDVGQHEARLADSRLAAVQEQLPARQRRDRRRRLAGRTAIAAGTVAVIAAAVALAGPAPDPVADAAGQAAATRAELFDPRNQPPQWPRFRFEDDLAGDPLIGAEIGGRGEDEVVLRFTPQTTNLAFSSFCRSRVDRGLRVIGSLNGRPVATDFCTEGDEPNSSVVVEDGYPRMTGAGWFDRGVRPGKESVLRYRLAASDGRPTADLGTRIGVAVYALTGPRVVSDGVVIKRKAERGDRDYLLGGYRTVKITRTRRQVSLTAPYGAGPGLVMFGTPSTRSTSTERMLFTIDGESLYTYRETYRNTGLATISLPGTGSHRLQLRARGDDTGALVLAWYRLDE